jgi:hypothetical protein
MAAMRVTRLMIGMAVALAAQAGWADGAREWREKMRPILPQTYLCRRASGAIVIDGKLDEAAWAAAPWTRNFVDIQGEGMPRPRFRTRAKLLWDDRYLYIAAELEEPHVWATIREHDAVIFQDPDFEVFISPTGGTQPYYEYEMNALNTSWDLLLDKPYMDEGKPHNEWDIPGMKTAVFVRGTINQPSDTDAGWTVEIAFPWNILSRHALHPGPPRDGEQWRIDFSRVEWQITTNGGAYQKVPHQPEDNWVWSPTGVIDMHRPEMWGQLQFAADPVATNGVRPIPGKAARDVALEVYYAEREYFKSHQRWAGHLEDLGLQWPGATAPRLEKTADGYVCAVEFADTHGRQVWRVWQDRRLELHDAPTNGAPSLQR